MNIKPTTEELRAWLVSTLKHSIQVEYYFDRLGVGKNDPERPHEFLENTVNINGKLQKV